MPSRKQEKRVQSKFNPADFDFPKDCIKYPDAQPWPKHKRIEWIKKMGNTIGYRNISKKEAAQMMGVSHRMIYKDFDAIYDEGVDPRAAKIAQRELDATFNMTLNELQKSLFNAKKASEKSALANAISNITREQQNFLERFGIHKSETPQAISGVMEVRWAKNQEEVNKEGEE